MLTDQTRAPLAEALERYVQKQVVRFHMPGHKGGSGISSLAENILGKRLFELDITGVMGMDDLLQPTGVIKAAEDLLAQAFGADESFFLINGTSSGLQALILSVCATGDTILVPRNMHKSMVAGVILSGAKPVFLSPEVNEEFGIALGVTPVTVQAALETHPEAKATLLINPTYYGTVCDLSTLAQIIHNHQQPLLVDEAHGPHFYFHNSLPSGALTQGADACAQGAHKTLCSLTQSSWLHVRGSWVDRERLRATLAVLLSTSASYPLLASLDLARRQMVLEGQSILDRTIELAHKLRCGLKSLPGLTVFDKELCSSAAAVDLDPTKVTVNVRRLGLTGQQVEQYLRYEHNIQVELSDLYNVLFMVGPGNDDNDVEALLVGFNQLVARYREKKLVLPATTLPPLPRQIMTPREAFFAAAESVPLTDSLGRVSTETITCYPPGIPILCPGEEITAEIVDYIAIMINEGYQVQGPRDGGLTRLRVVRD
ncbi:MAG: aminotransferase class I/II-fold pyridoxal phosphate-dependent enzyme [Firmicutes bacterium]|jgi:arginine decarboxylase|nr:aminotransferase class I/II-fold pyridoxal phosphate-dependent enzyme [Bacillota bacterium]